MIEAMARIVTSLVQGCSCLGRLIQKRLRLRLLAWQLASLTGIDRASICFGCGCATLRNATLVLALPLRLRGLDWVDMIGWSRFGNGIEQPRLLVEPCNEWLGRMTVRLYIKPLCRLGYFREANLFIASSHGRLKCAAAPVYSIIEAAEHSLARPPAGAEAR